VLGVAWAIIQPFFTMVVFSLFFGRLAKIPSEGVPYPIFSFAALVPWTFFAHSLTNSSNSLVSSANLIKKVYFPRLAIPLATALSGVVDFVIAFVMLLGMMLYYGITPTINALWLPALLLLALVTSLGVGLWLSALNVQYRDVRYTLPFLTQVWLFSTPIAYPSSLIPEQWRPVRVQPCRRGRRFRWALLEPILTRAGDSRLLSLLASSRRVVLLPSYGKLSPTWRKKSPHFDFRISNCRFGNGQDRIRAANKAVRIAGH
jgi:lipopolysaccharide transport system permease protein